MDRTEYRFTPFGRLPGGGFCVGRSPRRGGIRKGIRQGVREGSRQDSRQNGAERSEECVAPAHRLRRFCRPPFHLSGGGSEGTARRGAGGNAPDGACGGAYCPVYRLAYHPAYRFPESDHAAPLLFCFLPSFYALGGGKMPGQTGRHRGQTPRKNAASRPARRAARGRTRGCRARSLKQCRPRRRRRGAGGEAPGKINPKTPPSPEGKGAGGMGAKSSCEVWASRERRAQASARHHKPPGKLGTVRVHPPPKLPEPARKSAAGGNFSIRTALSPTPQFLHKPPATDPPSAFSRCPGRQHA